MEIIGILFTIVAFVCGLIILIHAFKSALWKGLVGLFCALYLLYYGFAEFQHPKKPLILAGWIVGALLGGFLNVWKSFSALTGG